MPRARIDDKHCKLSHRCTDLQWEYENKCLALYQKLNGECAGKQEGDENAALQSRGEECVALRKIVAECKDRIEVLSGELRDALKAIKISGKGQVKIACVHGVSFSQTDIHVCVLFREELFLK